MNRSISVTPEAVSALWDAVAIVADDQDAKRHVQAAERYRTERHDADPDEPWWIDLGGEDGTC